MKKQQIYTAWEQTPLKWHKFMSYVGMPLSILFSLSRFHVYFGSIKTLQGTEYAWLAWFDMTYAVILLGLVVVALIGLLKRKWFGPCCYIGGNIISCLYLAICLCLSTKYNFISVPSTLGQLIGYAVPIYFIYLYYSKRKLLFTRIDSKFTKRVKPCAQAPLPPISKSTQAMPAESKGTDPEVAIPDEKSRAASLDDFHGLFRICPQCGCPSPADEHCCRCGYRLSPTLLVYRLCPNCKRFVPQDQFKCECGYSFPAQEQLLHVCPECGAISSVEQRACDCGYEFQYPASTKPRRWPTIILCTLLVLLFAASTFLLFGWYHDHQLLVEADEQREDLLNKHETAIAFTDYYKDKVDELTSENAQLAEQKELLLDTVVDIADELSFWKNYAVIVTAGGGKYHTYGCPHIAGKTFWIYNIDLAKSKGYEPCLDCDPPQ